MGERPLAAGGALTAQTMREALADLVLVVHFIFVLFVVGGLIAIWAGALMRWRWIRRFGFRVAHLAAIVFVAAEAAAGVMCPLTVWEDLLRGRGGETGFLQRWVHAVLFYEFPAWVFTSAYIAFAVLVLVTFIAVPPRRRL